MRHGAFGRFYQRRVFVQTTTVNPALCPTSFIVRIEKLIAQTQGRYYFREPMEFWGIAQGRLFHGARRKSTPPDARTLESDKPNFAKQFFIDRAVDEVGGWASLHMAKGIHGRLSLAGGTDDKP
jgi:hypothetical protein